MNIHTQKNIITAFQKKKNFFIYVSSNNVNVVKSCDK